MAINVKKYLLFKYFITIMLKWFQHSTASVRWGGALSVTFNILAGVRQGGLLSPLLFPVYMDVLINRLRRSGLGCCMANNYFGCLVYADDIILLSHFVNTMRSMFAICEQFAFDFDMKFNTQKSVVRPMRVGERYDAMCAPLMLDGKEILFVHSLKLMLKTTVYTHVNGDRPHIENSKKKLYYYNAAHRRTSMCSIIVK